MKAASPVLDPRLARCDGRVMHDARRTCKQLREALKLGKILFAGTPPAWLESLS